MLFVFIYTAAASTMVGDELKRLEEVFNKQIQECESDSEVVSLTKKYGQYLQKLPDSPEREEALERAKVILENPADHVPEPEPMQLQLARSWDRIDGTKEALQEFGALLGKGSTEVDTDRHDDIRFPTGGGYLMSRMEMIPLIKGLASAQNTRASNKDVRHPGWPWRSFAAATYVGDFSYEGYRFNSLQLIMDSSTQVVAVQLKNDGGAHARKLGGILRPGYYNFVSSRRKGNPDLKVYGKSASAGGLHKIYTTLVAGDGEVLEACVLFIPQPIAALCRRIHESQ